jgi:hypothetical protein
MGVKTRARRRVKGAQAEADFDALMVPDQNPSSAKVKAAFGYLPWLY